MAIHLRTETDSRGDAVDYRWYCSQTCYAASFNDTPVGPEEMPGTVEEGGAYPCGAESDTPDYCATCGAPIGNPLTGEGEEYVRGYVADVAAAGPFPVWADLREQRQRAASLRGTYPYLFET